MRSDALKFAKERYFNGYSDTRSVQENFNLITSFIQDSADKHIPSKTSRSVSSVPWITPAIRDGPFEFLGGGPGLFLVRPSFFFLLPEKQDIFFRKVERQDIFFWTK